MFLTIYLALFAFPSSALRGNLAFLFSHCTDIPVSGSQHCAESLFAMIFKLVVGRGWRWGGHDTLKG